ncbi:MAG: FHA domain-containing protein, partial [Vicinamibacterales bacterium]
DHDRAKQDEIQRTEVFRVVKSTGDIPPKLLRFTSGDNAGETVIIRRGTIAIGRALDNDVIIDSAEVSRHHARIEVRNGVYQIVDLDSTNGTTVNGAPANHTGLNHGDVISLGTIAMEFLPYTGPGAVTMSAR